MKTSLSQLLLIPLLGMAVSCGSAKQYVYLNDMTPGTGYPFDSAHEAVIQANDRLSITVSCKQPELAIPFNIQSGSFKMSSDGTASSSPAANEPGYKVDAKGNIEFPILGNIHLEGLTLSQASDRIKNLIIDGDYIKAPIVSMEFLNFKYTVWGAVSKNGTFTVESGRITGKKSGPTGGIITSSGSSSSASSWCSSATTSSGSISLPSMQTITWPWWHPTTCRKPPRPPCRMPLPPTAKTGTATARWW